MDGLRLQPCGGGVLRTICLSSRCAGEYLWRILNAGLLLGGLAAILKSNLFAGIKERNYGLVYLLLVPLAVGNIDISQANPLVEGLLLAAIAAVYVERWNSAAICVAIATCFKIYPIAVGLLICVIAPRRFIGRILIALLLLLLVPFVFQHWSYVADQYQAWITTRTAEDRRGWPTEKLPLDLWFLIHTFAHLPISPRIYSLLQLGPAGALAFFCAVLTWKRWSKIRRPDRSVLLVSIWMTLCGPATESYTYLILAPAVILALVQAFDAPQPAGSAPWSPERSLFSCWPPREPVSYRISNRPGRSPFSRFQRSSFWPIPSYGWLTIRSGGRIAKSDECFC